MNKLLPGSTATVRYKGEEFEQIVQRLRYEVASPNTTFLLFMGMPRHQMFHAARTLAIKLGKQLYKVDLSTVSGKYIGETEKNLRRVFNKASSSNWVLFFDEADALFGKRTGVKGAHDRYANQEISYLLQRMEKYRGLIIASLRNTNGAEGIGKRMRKIIVKYPPA